MLWNQDEVLASTDLSAFTSEVPPSDPKELADFNFEIICRNDAAMYYFCSDIRTLSEQSTSCLVRAETYRSGDIALEQELFASRDPRRPVLMKGCRAMRRSGGFKSGPAIELCRRYLRRIKFTALTREKIFAKAHEVESRLRRKGHFICHSNAFVSHVIPSAYVWIDGQQVVENDPRVKAYKKTKGRIDPMNPENFHPKDPLTQLEELAAGPSPPPEPSRPSRSGPPGRRPSRDDICKWKAAYDALRELGIKF